MHLNLRHTLSDAEKREYLDAEVCLMNLPTKTGLPAAVSRFDDLIKSHQLQSGIVHGDAYFLVGLKFNNPNSESIAPVVNQLCLV